MLDYLGRYFGWLFGGIGEWLTQADSPLHKFLLMGVAIVAFIVAMGAVLFLLDRPRTVPRWAVVLGFAGPAGLALGFGLVYPALRTLYESFQNRNGTAWVGLDNYVEAFTRPEFQIVLRNTVVWVILVPLLSTFVGLLYAVLVDRTRLESLAKTLVFLPMAISMVGAGIIWKFVYEFRPDQPGVNQIGLLNQTLVWLGADPQQFLLHPPGNSVYLIVVMVWIQAGFAMTVLSAAIKAIPDDIVEAARLDGLGGARMFRYITVPSIRPALVVVVTTIAIVTLKVFDIVRTMTGGNFQTSVIANEFYNQSFRQLNHGLGSALAVILFVLVIPIVVYNIRQLRLSEEIR